MPCLSQFSGKFLLPLHIISLTYRIRICLITFLKRSNNLLKYYTSTGWRHAEATDMKNSTLPIDFVNNNYPKILVYHHNLQSQLVMMTMNSWSENCCLYILITQLCVYLRLNTCFNSADSSEVGLSPGSSFLHARLALSSI